MKILIVTPIHPTQIAEMITFFKDYPENLDILSIQSMALLAEETLNKNYPITNFIYAAECRKNPKLLKLVKENQIIFGNLSKTNKIKFDHIIGYTSNITQGEIFDPYLEQAKTIADPVFKQQGHDAIDWYSVEDCEHIFPTLHHLEVFLKTLGITKQEVNNGI